MERKIGEIFEHNGEWYQCVKGDCCRNCDFYDKFKDDICFSINNCSLSHRSDKTSVIFKKLKKVGGLIPYRNMLFQKLRTYIPSCNNCIFNIQNHGCYKNYYIEGICSENEIWVEVKQNKEDMQENKLNLKPFNLEKAKDGKPVCTRDGRKARIICFDFKSKQPIVAAISQNDGTERLAQYSEDGKYLGVGGDINHLDLKMFPQKREGWVNVYNSLGIITFSHNPYYTKEEALQDKGNYYVDTIKVSWRE